MAVLIPPYTARRHTVGHDFSNELDINTSLKITQTSGFLKGLNGFYKFQFNYLKSQ